VNWYGMMPYVSSFYSLSLSGFESSIRSLEMLSEALAYALRMWVCCSKRSTRCAEEAARHCVDTERADYKWHSASSPMRQSPRWPTLEPADSSITHHAWLQAPEIQCDFSRLSWFGLTTEYQFIAVYLHTVRQ